MVWARSLTGSRSDENHDIGLQGTDERPNKENTGKREVHVFKIIFVKSKYF
jgi:hypothetical protein